MKNKNLELEYLIKYNIKKNKQMYSEIKMMYFIIMSCILLLGILIIKQKKK